MGVWTRTLRAKTNLHVQVVTRCIKTLETQKLIKNVKSVKVSSRPLSVVRCITVVNKFQMAKHPTRKLYMLASLTPSVELTGGPWYTDQDLDTAFIDMVLKVAKIYLVNEARYLSISFYSAFCPSALTVRSPDRAFRSARMPAAAAINRKHLFSTRSPIHHCFLPLLMFSIL
jgi:hypothetical protein